MDQLFKLDFLGCIPCLTNTWITPTNVAPCVVLTQVWFRSEHSLKLLLQNVKQWLSVRTVVELFRLTPYKMLISSLIYHHIVIVCMLITDHPLKQFQHTSEDPSGHWVVGMVPASCHRFSGFASRHLLPVSGHSAERGQMSRLVLEIKGHWAVFTSHLTDTPQRFYIVLQWLNFTGLPFFSNTEHLQYIWAVWLTHLCISATAESAKIHTEYYEIHYEVMQQKQKNTYS